MADSLFDLPAKEPEPEVDTSIRYAPDEVCQRANCRHPYRVHFGTGPCISPHKGSTASVCPCIMFLPREGAVRQGR